MVLLTVNRYKFTSDWTIGDLLLKAVHDGYTVEDEIRDVKVKKETAVPFGIYKLGYRQSPKFSNTFLYSDKFNLLIDYRDKDKHKDISDWRPHDLIWIMNVPGFEYILLHWGNTDDDTEGCLIVGGGLGVINGQEGVVGSREYYKKLYCKIYPMIRVGNQEIEYKKAA